MKIRLLLAAAALVCFGSGAAWAQTALSAGTTFKIELQKKVDSKKSKVGDPVVAKCSENVKVGDAVVLPKNSILTGHITQVTPSESGAPAKLGILFDQATPKKGAPFALRAAITKVYAVDSNEAGMLGRPTEMGGSGVNLPLDAGNPAYAGFDRASNGIPIQYSIMETATGTGGDLGGVIISVGGNFTLDDGTHLQLRVLSAH